MKRFKEILLFSNLFYGICAVAMTVDAAMFERIQLPGVAYFLVIFLVTVLYYDFAYAGIFTLQSKKLPLGLQNERQQWYAQNKAWIFLSQIIKCAIILVLLIPLLKNIIPQKINLRGVFILCIFLVTALLYYGHIYFPRRSFTLRKYGLLKPFLIGFVWAGMVTVYPAFLFYLTSQKSSLPTEIMLFAFADYWLFISILCIMFDIKDYRHDANEELKTFVVRFGLRNTIYRILFPLLALNLAINFTKHIYLGLAWPILLTDLLVFICACRVAFSLSARRSIFFYLFVIDGLMLLKAAMGILLNAWY